MLLELYYVKQCSILVVASVKNQQTRPGLRGPKTGPLSGLYYPNGRTEARLRTVYGKQVEPRLCSGKA
jgi:hypothetical protein